jgi:hypothetical protein
MLARLVGAVFAALVLLVAVYIPADARRARHSLAPVPVEGAMVDDRYPHLRLPEAYATARAWRDRGSAGLSGVVPPLAAKAREITAACGSKVISGVRHTRIAGTRLMSLHASGRAVDIQGNPSCIYRHLANWPGGYSTDYARISPPHVHISYDPNGREWGRRFAHHHVKKRTRYAGRN